MIERIFEAGNRPLSVLIADIEESREFLYATIFLKKRKRMKLKEFWHDSVWSKVIAAGIIAAITWLGTTLLGFDWKGVFSTSFNLPTWGLAGAGLLLIAMTVLVVTVLQARDREIETTQQTPTPTPASTFGS
jgi:hypothetical protein